MSILGKIFGDANERYIKSLDPIVGIINKLEGKFEKLSSEELRQSTQGFKKRLEDGETLEDLLPEAFAAAREAAKRTLKLRHFDVQLIGGIALHQGKIAEMKTGEGKTLVATLPLYLNSLAGKGAHLVTPNDYLSRIGAGWMGPVYYALGASVAVIAHEQSGRYDPSYIDPEPHGDERLSHFRAILRHEAYRADITYGTNNEFGFDYLRDNLEYRPEDLRQREHHYAIVDEVDSILIDEARTPLIISAPDEESGELYKTFSRIVPQLKEGSDYNIDEKFKAVTLAEEGIDKMEKILGIGNIYEEKGIRFVRHLEQALRAQALFHKDKDYVVKNGEVVIVDEFTGRLMPGRRWSEGLHQAVEAKEGVEVQRESRTLATITFQNYFRMYQKLAGMTGTAQTSAEEFHKVYKLDVISVPTHRPMIRKDLPDFVFRTQKGKLEAVAKEVKTRHQKGQPVLIGTVSIEKNERLSRILNVEGIPHQMLNAKNHEQEALIIAQAGGRGAVTVATNMAGRGVDIILGGAPPSEDKSQKTKDKSPEYSEEYEKWEEEYKEVRSLGGLHVIGTERHEARRIDNQLRGRSGRQGDSGSSQFFVSLEDDLMRIFGSVRIKQMMETLGIPEDQPIENKMVSRAIEAAQAKIEGFHFDSRKHVLEFDDVLNKQRDAIYRMRREILFSQIALGSHSEAIAKESQDEKSSLKDQIFEILEEEIDKLVEMHTQGSEEEWNVEEIFETVKAIAGAGDEMHQKMNEIAQGDQEDKTIAIAAHILEVLKKLYDERERAMGEEQMRNIERAVMLRAVDILWMDHLDQMEHLRDSVRLRAYGQRDPLVEYKHEGARLFRELQAAIRAQIVSAIFKTGAMPAQDTPRRVEERRPEITGIMNPAAAQALAGRQESGIMEKNTEKTSVKKNLEIGRNDPCPCGATHPDGRSKKYKHCHGKNV